MPLPWPAFSHDLAVDIKDDDSPVTLAPLKRRFVPASTQRGPEDGWLGEETGKPGSTGLEWIVDPIDGTRNFVRGVPLWATLVACEATTPSGKQVVASAVGFPALDEWYDAAFELGARCGDQRIAVSTIDQLGESLWCFETPNWFIDNGLGRLFDDLVASTALQRGLCDAYGHALVASGRCRWWSSRRFRLGM